MYFCDASGFLYGEILKICEGTSVRVFDPKAVRLSISIYGNHIFKPVSWVIGHYP